MKNLLLKLFQNLIFTINYLSRHNLSEKNLLKNIKIKNGTVFDVGSNVGTFIEFINKNIEGKLKFHSFEPIAELCKFQEKNFSNLDIEINNIGIGSSPGKNIFYTNSVLSQSSFIKKENFNIGKVIKKEEVLVNSIDNYCEENNIEFIDILKIDTEGTDYDALLSAKNMFQNKAINLIKIEITNEPTNLSNIFLFFQNYNYELLGFCNQKFTDNRVLFVDAYFIKP